jgi:subtilisin family serine protease
MRGVTARKEWDGVPLRFPRPVTIAAGIGLVAAWSALAIVPAQADQVRQGEWWLAALQITQAQRTTTGSGVTIALLDTGVDAAQPDIAGSVINGSDFTHSGEKPGSEFYGIHGTAMASLIVGHGHGPGNSDGILGVAPAARLLSVRVGLDSGDPLLTDSTATSALPAAIAQGITYAVESGAQVIDLPLDPGQSPNALVASTTPLPVLRPGQQPSPTVLAQQAAAGGSAAEKAAVAFALSRGVVLVAPAGDNNAQTDDPNFPADYPGVISVGAFDSNIIKAPFSSRQSYVTLTASGSGMTAAIPQGGYTTVSSTAAASAIVTGIAALIKSVYPELTPAQVTQALINGTTIRPAGGMTDGSGHGTADAAKALAAAAAIARPSPHRAGSGAVSRQLPAASPVPFVDRGLGPKLERDGLISGAVLVVLLLPIGGYALARSRRRARSRALTRERAPAGRPAYAPADVPGDQMLEYFAAAPAQPSGARPRSLGTPAPAAGRSGVFGALADAGGAAGEPAARRAGRLPLTPMARASAARPPKVSGTPPWEPAPKPDTELPWATSPPPALPRRTPMMPAPPAAPGAPATAPGSPGAPATAPGSLWDVAAPAGKAGGVGGAGAIGVGAGGAGEGGGDQAAGDDSESGSRPIYVWNPSANTEALPKVPRDGG